MTVQLKILFICVSILILFFVINKIRKAQLQISDAIIWILGALFLVVISIFADVMTYLAELLGFYSTVNFVFALFIFFLLVIAFSQSIKISVLNDKIKNLNHYVALQEKKKKGKE